MRGFDHRRDGEFRAKARQRHDDRCFYRHCVLGRTTINKCGEPTREHGCTRIVEKSDDHWRNRRG